MKQIKIADKTLCRDDRAFSFKERLEIIRQLEKLKCDIIELPEIKNARTDILLVRTASSFVKNSVISVAAGSTEQSIDDAVMALSAAAKGRIRIEVPTSPVGMEYFMHKKPDKMIEWVKYAVEKAVKACDDVEFCAVDATRAEFDFLENIIKAAVEAGAKSVSVCDSAAGMLPDDFASFGKKVTEVSGVCVGVDCSDKNGLACAEAIMAVRQGVSMVKTTVGGDGVPFETFVGMIKNCGDNYGFCSGISYTEIHRIISQIRWVCEGTKNDKNVSSVSGLDEHSIRLDAKDDISAVAAAVAKLGFDLSDEDNKRVHEEVCRVAEKKTVGAKELDAIVATVALQVPDSYKLESYVINNGNIISASAQITLSRDGKMLQGIAIGDGPIDAAFVAIEQIIGHRYELDDFQIQSVTEGKEAVGSALVKLRFEGKLYSGNGISTDIIGASIRAYISAVNKIVYDEHNN
ncbi:MAG: hypothetical protein E7574_05830 [Ruminococcaceae bacterium]|nr:hypothetical protein [Oscillospiraceae bacterium]